jgi:hypothetical protein
VIDARVFSVIASLAVVTILFVQRRVIFSWSAIGTFCMTNLFFVFVGVLALPWVRSSVEVWFPGYAWSLVTDKELKQGIVLTAGGGGLVLLFYQLSHLFFTKGRFIRRAPNLLSSVSPITLGFSSRRLLILSLVSLLCVMVFVLSKLSVFLWGFRQGILGGRPDLVIVARRAATSNYLFVLLVYNVIPFFGVALWLLYRIRGGCILRFYAILFNICAATLLLLIFQKRPLMVFLSSLFLANLWVQQIKLRHVIGRWRSGVSTNIINKKKMLIYGTVLFAILLGLYYAQTQIGRSGEGLFETVSALSRIAILRIVGRLSISPLMYVLYFPSVEPHYGLTNLGLLSKILGFELFLDTRRIFQYFTGLENGSVAISALIDFYGAFGIIGWLFGTILLGILLDRLDAMLVRLRPNAGNILFIIFMFVFVYYLSQASLARSLLGYGGGIFVLLWIMLKLRLVKTVRARDKIIPVGGPLDGTASGTTV